VIELHHNGLSTCSQKVRLVLAEKGLEWQGQHLDLWRGEQQRPEYLALNPGGVVPTLVDGGRVIIESSVIMEYLDEAFPEPALKPGGAAERAAMRLWTKQLDEGVHGATSTLSNAVAFRYLFLDGAGGLDEARLQRMPDPARRARKREQILEGMESPLFAAALGRIKRLFADMESALERQPWLAGDGLSLADLALAPTLGRIEQLHFQGLLAARPQLAEWFGRMQARASYAEAVTAWLEQDDLDLMAEKGEAARPRAAEILA